MLFSIFLQFILAYFILLVLTDDYRISLKESLLVLCGGFVASQIFRVIGIYTSILLFSGVFLIRNTIKKDVLNNAMGTFYSAIIITIGDHLSSIVMMNFGVQTMELQGKYIMYHIIISYLISIILALILIVAMKKVNKVIEFSFRIKLFMTVIGAFIVFTFYMSIYLGSFLGNSIKLVQLNTIFFLVYLTITTIIFYIYSISLRNNYRAKQKELEMKNSENYIREIEKQYREMRKFRHDYQNILMSMDSYIEDGDFNGLKTYFNNNIKKSSQNIAQNNFKLENLSKIHVKEIKSVLSSKLLTAQEYGIDTNFEAIEDIKSIPMDSIILVRAIGILLDNAIEELVSLGHGKLSVGMIKDQKTIMFIVQNTCRNSLERVHKLKAEGFSTKGINRGIGLSSLREMIQGCPNTISETTIQGDMFIQKIIIEGES